MLHVTFLTYNADNQPLNAILAIATDIAVPEHLNGIIGNDCKFP